MSIPQSEILSTGRMNRIFDNTVATYKYYWFASILDLFVLKGKTRMDIWNVMVEMVVKAWYPACFFHLSFGKSDSLYDAISELHEVYQLPVNIKTDDLRTWLHQHRETTHVRSLLRFLPQNVPYRFLRPWIDTSDDKAVVLRSQTYENGCPYSLHKEQGTMWVELNSEWLEYFQSNYIVLHDFAYWNLALFLQVRNPNVPNIPNKLIKDDSRNSLTKQHEYWDFAMQHGLDMRCIYTNIPLHKGTYDLDHFIPWSFVSHDLIWNLLPADGSINSSKSDKLPDLDKYLKPLALLQQQAVQTCLRHDFHGKVLEDYLSLGCTINEFAEMNKGNLFECFRRTYAPMHQIALNMGFEQWNY